MKVQVHVNSLLNVVNEVGKYATGKSSLPVLNHLYLQSNVAGLLVTATNLETVAQGDLLCQVSELGTATADKAQLLKALRALKKAKIEHVDIVAADTGVILYHAAGNLKVSGVDTGGFPIINRGDFLVEKPVALSAAMVHSAFWQLANCVYTDYDRDSLRYILVNKNDIMRQLEFVSTDGFQMYTAKLEGDNTPGQNSGGGGYLPGAVVKHVAAMARKADDVWIGFVGDRRYWVKVDNIELWGRVDDMHYPDYEAVLKPTRSAPYHINGLEKTELIAGLELLLGVIGDQNYIVLFVEVGATEIVLSHDGGSYNIPCAGEVKYYRGNEEWPGLNSALTVGVNPHMLLAYVKANKAGHRVNLRLSSPREPLVLHSDIVDDTWLLMPSMIDNK